MTTTKLPGERWNKNMKLYYQVKIVILIGFARRGVRQRSVIKNKS